MPLLDERCHHFTKKKKKLHQRLGRALLGPRTPPQMDMASASVEEGSHGAHGQQARSSWAGAINVGRLLHARSGHGSSESPRALRLSADEAAVAADPFKREDAIVLRRTVLRQHPSSRATLESEDIR